MIMLAVDSSGVIPSISKLTPGQTAYHFLAGYQNGNFVPAYESRQYGSGAQVPFSLHATT
jgi:hypothetical protein